MTNEIGEQPGTKYFVLLTIEDQQSGVGTRTFFWLVDPAEQEAKLRTRYDLLAWARARVDWEFRSGNVLFFYAEPDQLDDEVWSTLFLTVEVPTKDGFKRIAKRSEGLPVEGSTQQGMFLWALSFLAGQELQEDVSVLFFSHQPAQLVTTA